MAKRVPGHRATLVTPGEVKAAQVMVRRLRDRGEQPSPVLIAIAEAKPSTYVEPASVSAESNRTQPA